MTKKQALALMMKRHGETAWAKDSGIPADEKSRAWASEQRKRFPKPQAPNINEWPAEDTVGEFRTAVARYEREYKKWKKRDNDLFAQAIRYRYSVGTVSRRYGMTAVLGQGDTWEEALQKAGVSLPSKAAT